MAEAPGAVQLVGLHVARGHGRGEVLRDGVVEVLLHRVMLVRVGLRVRGVRVCVPRQWQVRAFLLLSLLVLAVLLVLGLLFMIPIASSQA